LDAGGSQRTDGRFAARTRTGDANIHRADAVIARHVGGVHGGLLRGKRSTLAGSAEAERAGALPAEGIALLVGDGHDGVVERGLNVHQSERHTLALALLA